MRTVRKSPSGFSLIEVMITLVLVLLGLLVLLSSMVAMAKSNRYSQRMDIANTLARREIERIRNMDYDNVLSESGAYGEYDQFLDYRHVTAVTDLGTVKQVTVQVFFENDRRNAEVLTFVADL